MTRKQIEIVMKMYALQIENEELKSTLDKIKVKINELYEKGKEYCWDTYDLEDITNELLELIKESDVK